jgi:ABC-type uncharacterized transport system ATPase subunit
VNEKLLFLFKRFFLAEKEKTFIIATHRIADWETSTNERKIRVIEMKDGKIVFDGYLDKYKINLDKNKNLH